MCILTAEINTTDSPVHYYSKCKGKAVPAFKQHAMKTYWGVEVQLHSFFELGTRWR
jgi:hypothetical protein